MSKVWCKRFVVASVIHGLGIAIWSGLFLLDGIGITLNMSRIIAGGSVGTWFTLGYLLYFITGCVGMGVQGAIYYFVTKLSKRDLYSEKLALSHFVLMNIAIVGATWMLAIVGFKGGTLLLEGKTAAEIHPQIVMYVSPIGYCIIVGVIAAIIGALNVLMSFAREPAD